MKKRTDNISQSLGQEAFLSQHIQQPRIAFESEFDSFLSELRLSSICLEASFDKLVFLAFDLQS